MYIKITCSNEFCGCDEDFYREVKDSAEAEDIAEDCLTEEYAFREPDGRFLEHASDIFDSDYEEYEDDCESYNAGLSVYWEEITKEEYEENT